jgi:hypothetical protein
MIADLQKQVSGKLSSDEQFEQKEEIHALEGQLSGAN